MKIKGVVFEDKINFQDFEKYIYIYQNGLILRSNEINEEIIAWNKRYMFVQKKKIYQNGLIVRSNKINKEI